MAKKTKKKRESSNGASAPRRSYERTTPVGRVKKHVEKALRIATFAAERMAPWSDSPSADLTNAATLVQQGVYALRSALDHVDKLFNSGWVPPKKSMALTFSEGDEVRVSEKHREKYLQVYTAAAIDNLVVAKCLPTGEIAVRYSSASPFIVAKSHVEKRRPSADRDTERPASKRAS